MDGFTGELANARSGALLLPRSRELLDLRVLVEGMTGRDVGALAFGRLAKVTDDCGPLKAWLGSMPVPGLVLPKALSKLILVVKVPAVGPRLAGGLGAKGRDFLGAAPLAATLGCDAGACEG